ncbi:MULTISPECIES: aspartyl-phosphate phosphatase Spo0E family protein [Priestia]|uniref:aspartyl-phosphate phosphatase Spo0E family protein n=1 Tax=Priestia TaxID=2800373 RepID=UPI0011AA54F6|nr:MULTISPECIES: aspartyl-phosphate phosphatase Spo0E family protein [Priestia]MBK0009976.1 aspartyl-phosphate phosphatase Spo0E family protein [Bacillus sp. S35]MCM3256045.1 aspartyl-phosphate phosphatase Spo0E family protein [Priestia aryabhattai]MCM3644547.1 aspartyl-phosphate phosphatase Spo0E family protein [Priestia aryabhattai]
MLMVINSVGQIKDLQKCISKKRKELIDLGNNCGLLDKNTIKCSQDLDKLINLHMKSHSSSTNMFLDYGGDLPRKRHSYGNRKVSDFIYEIKAVELARSNIRFCSAQLIAHSNLATFGVCTALVLVGNGTKAGFVARQNLRQLTTHS